MTRQQQEELAKLQFAYFEAVAWLDTDKQKNLLDQILYWIKKQMAQANAKMAISMGEFDISVLKPIKLSLKQEMEFGLKQMSMVKCWASKDDEGMIIAINNMCEWIDDQIAIEVSSIIKPKLKIIRPGEK